MGEGGTYNLSLATFDLKGPRERDIIDRERGRSKKEREKRKMIR